MGFLMRQHMPIIIMNIECIQCSNQKVNLVFLLCDFRYFHCCYVPEMSNGTREKTIFLSFKFQVLHVKITKIFTGKRLVAHNILK
jgi:hypothetical protein